MQGLITGAASVKEVFADMLKSIADVLAQQAAQMIATYIAIGIARAFAGMGKSGADPIRQQLGLSYLKVDLQQAIWLTRLFATPIEIC